jgi:hypothetical protein
MQEKTTLGQLLRSQRPELEDFACNLYGEDLLRLDFFIESETDSKTRDQLIVERELLKREGEIAWLMNAADQITHLSVKVGLRQKRRMTWKDFDQKGANDE